MFFSPPVKCSGEKLITSRSVVVGQNTKKEIESIVAKKKISASFLIDDLLPDLDHDHGGPGQPEGDQR